MRCSELLRTLRVKFLIFSLLILPLNSFGAEVVLKVKSRVSGREVTLGEIATIKGTPVERELLSSVPVADAPPPCGYENLSKEAVAKAVVNYIRENGVSFKKIEIKGAERIIVFSTCSIVDGEHLKRLILNFFKQNYPDYEVISVPRITVKLPYRKFKEKLSLDYLGNYSARFIYEITVNGEVVKKFWIPVRVERKVKVVVAAKPIPRGTKITLDEITLKKVRESRARGGTDNVSSVIGATARRDFLPGDVITERGIVPNFAVKKNQPVRVVYRNGAIKVELLGIALQDGVVGNIIKVKNPSTGKVLICKVTGNGLVEFVSQ